MEEISGLLVGMAGGPVGRLDLKRCVMMEPVCPEESLRLELRVGEGNFTTHGESWLACWGSLRRKVSTFVDSYPLEPARALLGCPPLPDSRLERDVLRAIARNYSALPQGRRAQAFLNAKEWASEVEGVARFMRRATDAGAGGGQRLDRGGAGTSSFQGRGGPRGFNNRFGRGGR